MPGVASCERALAKSTLLAEAWRPQVEALLLLPGLNHFSVVDALAERGNPLYEATLALFTRAAKA